MIPLRRKEGTITFELVHTYIDISDPKSMFITYQCNVFLRGDNYTVLVTYRGMAVQEVPKANSPAVVSYNNIESSLALH